MRLPQIARWAAMILACSFPASFAANAAAAVRPRLVVVVIVDGLPQHQVMDYRDQLAADGLRRFLDRGAWFADAHYGHSLTVTAPGHATIMTGASPSRHGIVANQWIDSRTGEPQYCTADPGAVYIGHGTRKLDGTSPRNLKVETVGDVLRRANPASKVVAISGKDRGAILPAGKSGVAYIYQAQSGMFSSSTYYMPAHPAWVEAFNASRPAERYFQAEWKPLLDAPAYSRSLADGQPWYLEGGRLPRRVGEGLRQPGPAFYAALLGSPFIDELTLQFARAALAGEALGKDDAPDILAVSLSGHDYINHAYSAQSRLSHDHVLRLDRMLEAFFRHLDETIGKENFLAVLTADHGFMPAPEYSRSLGHDAGRFDLRPALAGMQAGLAKRFGDGHWVLGNSLGAIMLNKPLAAERKVDVVALVEEARRLLVAAPGVQAVFTRIELESGSRKGAPFFDQVRRSWNPEVSADIELVLKPHWIFSSAGGRGTSHGSPHPDDTHVPLMFYGPTWVKPRRFDARVDMVDIAPTLARILGLPALAAAEGKPLLLEVAGR